MNPGEVWYNKKSNTLYAIVFILGGVVAYFTPYKQDIQYRNLKDWDVDIEKGNMIRYGEV